MEWISVKDRLPNEILRVLIYTTTGRMAIGYYYRGEWEEDARHGTFSHFGYEVKSWMPLPEPPKS